MKINERPKGIHARACRGAESMAVDDQTKEAGIRESKWLCRRVVVVVVVVVIIGCRCDVDLGQ